jgi:succinyl-CoA synthetase beta subunit
VGLVFVVGGEGREKMSESQVRLQGTNFQEARELIQNSGLRIVMADDLDDAAVKVCL